jgi:hypothetical protein
VALVTNILDHLDKIASIVAAVLGLITFFAAKRQAEARPDGNSGRGLRAHRWWTPHRLRIVAVISLVLCLVLVVRALPDTRTTPDVAPSPDPVRTTSSGPRPGDLRAGGEVPLQYREAITAAAHGCGRPGVTPALIAAILYAESRFDPGKRSPETDEYGIAMWTPTVFKHWAPKLPDGRIADVFNPDDAIAALGPFLCELSQTVGYLSQNNPQPLIAAGYRVGGQRVRDANGVPPNVSDYVSVVRQKTVEYGY